MLNSTSVLNEIIANKQRELNKRKTAVFTSDLERTAITAKGTFLTALQSPGIKLITEVKPASPSAGVLQQTVDIDKLLGVYDKYACAISVLTDKKYFGGSLELLKEVAGKSNRPTLCKDFILDEIQVLEARRNGAEAVLLIVKALSKQTLFTLNSAIERLNMTAVVEVQNEEELETALRIDPKVILINNRNLDSLAIDLSTTARLAPLIPQDIVVVSASGIESRADLEKLKQHCSCFLIGTALMKSTNLESTLQELLK